MPAIIPRYEYDIFISYRQKDNRSDQWVTQFVQALKEELDATFKEDISVYFDENPHDGLHDTHNVDDSLKEKVKCLIFIPIVSRTYCDPKSFAWQKEFLPFLEFAKNDDHGLKVKLSNGNVTSRILPIRIHDLDKEDVDLFEKETGSVIRSIDFVYSETGVNRPLRPKVDDPAKNQNHTVYRDQINKVANAIREIIEGMKSGGSNQLPHQASENTNVKETTKSKTLLNRKNNKQIAIWASLVVVIALALFYINSIFKSSDNTYRDTGIFGTSIVVFPFNNLNNDTAFDYLSNGIPGEIRSTLYKISGLSVKPEHTSKSIKESGQSIAQIGSELGIEVVLDGSTSRIGDQIIIQIELIDALEDQVMWSKSFKRNMEDIQNLYQDIALEVASHLQIELSPAEEQNLSVEENTLDITAYDYYLNAKESIDNYGYTDEKKLRGALQLLNEAVTLDSSFAEAYLVAGKIARYGLRWHGVSQREWLDSALMLTNKAIGLKPQLASAYVLRANLLNLLDKPVESKSAIKKANDLASGEPEVMNALANQYFKDGNYEKLARMDIRSNDIEYEQNDAEYYGNFAWSYVQADELDKAELLFKQQLKLAPASERALFNLGWFYAIFKHMPKKSLKYLHEAHELYPDGLRIIDRLAWNYYELGDLDNAEKYWLILSDLEKDLKDTTQHIFYRARLGHVKWLKGEKEVAMKLFKESMKLDSTTINSSNLNGVEHHQVDYYRLGAVHSFLGNKKEALEILDYCQKEAFFPLPSVEIDPFLDSLRDDPKFKEILGRAQTKKNKIKEAYRKVLREYEVERELKLRLKR